MKNTMLKNIGLAGVLAAGLLANASASNPVFAAASKKIAKKQVYTCVMHPQIRSLKPGKCPKCGMKLVPMKAKPAHK